MPGREREREREWSRHRAQGRAGQGRAGQALPARQGKKQASQRAREQAITEREREVRVRARGVGPERSPAAVFPGERNQPLSPNAPQASKRERERESDKYGGTYSSPRKPQNDGGPYGPGSLTSSSNPKEEERQERAREFGSSTSVLRSFGLAGRGPDGGSHNRDSPGWHSPF